MKKLLIFWIGIILIGCAREKTVIDSTQYENINVEILSKGGEFGEEIRISQDSKEFIIDVEGMNPWKIDFANVDGNEMEVAIGVYKESPHHKEVARRVFLYNIDFENQRLKPKLRISRLNNPIADFIMMDIDQDGFEEIISIEITKDEKYQLGGYSWTNFAFEKIYSSEKLEEEPKFLDKNGSIKVNGKNCKIILNGDEIIWE